MNDREKLENVAYDIADQHRSGTLKLTLAHGEREWDAMCREIARQCPGFQPGEYSDALNQGFQDSR